MMTSTLNGLAPGETRLKIMPVRHAFLAITPAQVDIALIPSRQKINQP
jgi:hypothetical protein